MTREEIEEAMSGDPLDELKEQVGRAKRRAANLRNPMTPTRLLAMYGGALIAATELAENEAEIKRLGESIDALEPPPGQGGKLSVDDWEQIDEEQDKLMRTQRALAQKSKTLVAAYRAAKAAKEQA